MTDIVDSKSKIAVGKFLEMKEMKRWVSTKKECNLLKQLNLKELCISYDFWSIIRRHVILFQRMKMHTK